MVAKWGDGIVNQRLQPLIGSLKGIDFYDAEAKFVTRSPLWGLDGEAGYPAHCGDIARIFFDHAKELGVEMHFSSRVSAYWETDSEAGVGCQW